MRTFPGKLTTLAAACLLNVSSYAARTNTYTASASYSRREKTMELTPLPTRTFAEGTLAPTGFLYGDTMIPIVGNSEGFGFLDGTAKGGTDKGWLAALGAGLREVWGGAIFGGYVFGEYDRTVLGNNYWVINPGLEMMTPHWDARINGYLPLGSRFNTNAIYLGSQLGITCPTFIGHQQFDQIFNDANEVAPGLDAQIGYIIPNLRRTRIFGGYYFFDFNKTTEINGVVGGVEMPVNHNVSLLFRDSYDNVNRNTAVFTIRLYLGGLAKVDENDVHERLLDPMERHIGVLYTGAGIPAQQVLYNTGELALQRDNIWFFSPTANGTLMGIQSCTYENPCSSGQFNQPVVNSINNLAPFANFYLADGGNYFMGQLTLNYGQSIYGRTADFCQIAPGSPVLLGNLTLNGSNNLQAFQLLNQLAPGATTGISATNVQNINIDRVKVGPAMEMVPFASTPFDSFQTGILLDNTQNVLITKSTINAADAKINVAPQARAIVAQNGTTLTLDGDILNTRVTTRAQGQSVQESSSAIAALDLRNTGNINVYNSGINLVSDGLNFQRGASFFTPVLSLYSNGISIVKDNLVSPMTFNSRNNQVKVITYLQQPTPVVSTGPTVMSSTGRGLYVFNNTPSQITINSTGDDFFVKAVQVATTNPLNVQQYQFAQRNNNAIDIKNNAGLIEANLANDNVNLALYQEFNVNMGGSTPAYNNSLRLQAVNSTINVNSTNNKFNNTMKARVTQGSTGSYVYQYYNAVIKLNSEGNNNIFVNSRGDMLNFTTQVVGNISFVGSSNNSCIYISQYRGNNSTAVVNTMGDQFNLTANLMNTGGYDVDISRNRLFYSSNFGENNKVNINSVNDIGNMTLNGASAGGNSIIRYNNDIRLLTDVNSTTTLTLTGDRFNMVINALGGPGTSATYNSGVYSGGTGAATLNLNNNIFTFRIRANQVPVNPVFFVYASPTTVVNNYASNSFRVY